jgi:hypothetical protein
LLHQLARKSRGQAQLSQLSGRQRTVEGGSQKERRSAAVCIDGLNDAAKDFSAGNILPRPKPGEPAAMLRDA